MQATRFFDPLTITPEPASYTAAQDAACIRNLCDIQEPWPRAGPPRLGGHLPHGGLPGRPVTGGQQVKTILYTEGNRGSEGVWVELREWNADGYCATRDLVLEYTLSTPLVSRDETVAWHEAFMSDRLLLDADMEAAQAIRAAIAKYDELAQQYAIIIGADAPA